VFVMTLSFDRHQYTRGPISSTASPLAGRAGFFTRSRIARRQAYNVCPAGISA